MNAKTLKEISVIICEEGKLMRGIMRQSDLPRGVSLLDLVTGPYEKGTDRKFYLRRKR